ncbi:hypothetical protein ACPJXG_13720 [Janthinobacterium sp. NFX145]|uniref:phosphorylase family protein n=1 Tax=Janthinobacterium sp. NFX145 TaxID=3415602 RepID=UPI003CC58D47
MNFLIIEDREEKRQAVEAELRELDPTASIVHTDNLDDARIKILTMSFDLIIFDLYLPLRKGEEEQDISEDLINVFAQSKNYHCESIALTLYKDKDLSNFNNHGITVVAYDSDDKWKLSLSQKFARLEVKPRCDFLIFCALSKERAAFSDTSARLGDLSTIGGLNCQEIFIDDFSGFCITPRRMGLVHMAIAAAKAIEIFQPKAVGMSGICAGVDGATNLLDIVIGDICWEYQTGKFKDNQFLQEPYQAPVSSQIRTLLEQLIEDKAFLSNLKAGLFDTELKTSKLTLGPISSGSAVVADEARMAEIGIQHRKWAALEMEMYAMYEAAIQSQGNPIYFAAKSVVDMGNSGKGDALHNSACVLSARFVTEVMRRILPKYV